MRPWFLSILCLLLAASRQAAFGAEPLATAPPPATAGGTAAGVPDVPQQGEVDPRGDDSGAGRSRPGMRLTVLPREGVAGEAAHRFEMGEILTIQATGELRAIDEELAKPPASRTFVLYLDGQPMAGLPVSVLQGGSSAEIRVQFCLLRDSSADASRAAWNRFLGQQKEYRTKPSVALAIGSGLALPVGPDEGVELAVASSRRITLTFWGALAFFVGSFVLLARWTSALRDTPSGPYSLGKSQMAFWGLLVVSAFGGVWIVTGAMERIPAQVLTLLGISAGTGLGSLLIGASKEEERKAKLVALHKEGDLLLRQEEASGGTLPPAEATRLDQIAKEIEALAAPPRPPSFFRDLCDDGTGTSFHRVQIAIWTLVLGAVFVRQVGHTISMPEFPETLLVLMGISGGTYLGFKVPEK